MDHLANAEKRLLQGHQVVTIIGYPPDVPARIPARRHGCRSPAQFFAGCLIRSGVFRKTHRHREVKNNLTSDPHRHNEKRLLPSPVVDVSAHAHHR